MKCNECDKEATQSMKVGMYGEANGKLRRVEMLVHYCDKCFDKKMETFDAEFDEMLQEARKEDGVEVTLTAGNTP